MSPLKVCFVSAEVSPFAKAGGLGDVSAALPRTLVRLGHEVRLFLPFYSQVDRREHRILPVESMQNLTLRLGTRPYRYSVHTSLLPRSSAALYLIHCPALYDRPGIYGSDADEPLRFALLTRAAIECCQRMVFGPDVFHCNDWHTALLPLYLRTLYDGDRLLARSRTVLTLHNVGYQGVFSADALAELGLAEHARRFDEEDLQAGRINFLKTGILYADALNTVSPNHAREIQTAEYGMGLDGLLRRRSDRLSGILNGVDTEEWNPETDPLIPYQYSLADLEGKSFDKLSLMKELGLDFDARVPALGIVTRLVRQKGIELLRDVLPGWLSSVDCRLVAVGSGEADYEEFFGALQARFPERVSFYRGHNNQLAHRIEAGCDLFLMPSLYEPCGLNQMYSLAYGTPPVVRRTGGLADSVRPFNRASGDGTGFVFEDATAEALRRTLEAAFEVWEDRAAWDRLVRNCMQQDVSWERRAGEYVELYRRSTGR